MAAADLTHAYAEAVIAALQAADIHVSDHEITPGQYVDIELARASWKHRNPYRGWDTAEALRLLWRESMPGWYLQPFYDQGSTDQGSTDQGGTADTAGGPTPLDVDATADPQHVATAVVNLVFPKGI